MIKDQKGRIRTGLRMRLKDKSRDNIFYEYTPINALGKLDAVPNNFYSGEDYQAGNKYVPGFL
ncbi:hypothetical protein OKW96_11165 [Sphingobacterium sp. KU25419]|nr:hypothetical protein OKW96_11165 [Sphingobacterium sp. KU25419]